MTAWDLACEPFIKERLEDLEEFDYFDFAAYLNDEEQHRINLYYVKTLDTLIKYKSELTSHCKAKKEEFTVSSLYFVLRHML
jgi:hypothetical protein